MKQISLIFVLILSLRNRFGQGEGPGQDGGGIHGGSGPGSEHSPNAGSPHARAPGSDDAQSPAGESQVAQTQLPLSQTSQIPHSEPSQSQYQVAGGPQLSGISASRPPQLSPLATTSAGWFQACGSSPLPWPLCVASAVAAPSSGASDGVSGQVPAATSGPSQLSGQGEPRSANGFPVGAVAGGAIGGVGTAAILAGVGVLLFCLVRRHMRTPSATTDFIVSDEKDKCKEKKFKEDDSARNERRSQIVPSAPPPSYYLATNRAETAATIAPPLYEEVA